MQSATNATGSAKAVAPVREMMRVLVGFKTHAFDTLSPRSLGFVACHSVHIFSGAIEQRVKLAARLVQQVVRRGAQAANRRRACALSVSSGTPRPCNARRAIVSVMSSDATVQALSTASLATISNCPTTAV
mmetsp:Transcript_34397/g.90183  ORF Transcript_34397/g.90183 Transcript_34397/m.90183 type:complete len:131 (-) Transcript_34397:1008-1400(-)